MTEIIKVDNHILFTSSAPLPPAPSLMTVPARPSLLIDLSAPPQRSTLQLVCRLIRGGWSPSPDQRAKLAAWAERGLTSHQRLRQRSREALAALGVTQPPSGDENAAQAILARLALDAGNRTNIRDHGHAGKSALHCPACRSGDVHPGRGSRWTCSSCGQALVMRANGRLARETESIREQRQRA